MSVRSVLVVEDDEWLAQLHARVLNTAGYKTQIAPNALVAIQMIDDELPDVIVLDVLLTGSTAFALLHELQSYGDTGDIPIILCTNLASDLSVKDLAPYGVRLIIDKTTMKPNDLIESIREII